MRNFFGYLLLIVWFILLILSICEPDMNAEPVETPTWVGWSFVIIFLGAPFVGFYLLDNKPRNP